MFYPIMTGIKVVEYGSLVTAPFCTKMLADVGAEVIKIEEPMYGDETRRWEPILYDYPGLENSGLFQYLNMGKKGITLNLKTTTGKKIFYSLIEEANIYVENNPIRKNEELEITYDQIKKVNPGIIVTSITPFGQTGPYRDYKSCELVSANMGGCCYASTREVDVSQEPIKQPAHLFSFQAGLSAAVATMGAFYRQTSDGLGEHLDVSEQESVFQNLPLQLQFYLYGNQIVSRTDHLDRAPFHILPCKDGYIYHAFLEEHQWQRFLDVMGNPDWADSELFKDYQTRAQYWDALKPLLLEWTMEHTIDEIYRRSQEKGAPVGPVYTAKDILNSQQFIERNYLVETDHPEIGKFKYPGVPYVFSEISRDEPSSAPLLGQHNEEIYCGRLGYTKKELLKLREAGVI